MLVARTAPERSMRRLSTVDESDAFPTSFASWNLDCPRVYRCADKRGEAFTTYLWGSNTESRATWEVAGGAIFGVALSDSVLLHEGDEYPLHGGMYFAVPHAAVVKGGSGLFIALREKGNTLFTLGGPIEEQGALRYIDGCSDTLLIAPMRLGEPCLNYLHFPSKTKQTRHTHPSSRVGLVMRGRGTCFYGQADEHQVPLRVGTAFVIPRDVDHYFETDDAILDVIAWHPDSDFGPTDDNHPMINRTILDCVQTAQSSPV
eukprot:CAMPEP_0197394272 /NCGR_PEP_ID=MMETSP1165-20131217/4786_1 /TAXON_ID=284809 /ORGANISM="Chrysocystis fragilis, Strain CCMP3189" /LENGTH=259 /DNA_ID=CAMNT_0042919959 /DNA_START=92 /DNA_END=871 /DNA_ORIENTATION=-